MFKIPVIKSCPVTKHSSGRVTLPVELIRELAGTVHEEKGQEWLILLYGTRSESGLDATITNWAVPPEQERAHSTVDLPEMLYPSEIIGVLHSHHSMGAFFSGTDDTKLNPRFAISIVISSKVDGIESKWLGFSYKAEGRVKLPCGAMGVVDFGIAPEGIEDWPIQVDAAFEQEFTPEMSKQLGDCCYKTTEKVSNGWYETAKTACGIASSEPTPIPFVFGQSANIAAELPAPKFQKYQWKPGGGAVENVATRTGNHANSKPNGTYGGWSGVIDAEWEDYYATADDTPTKASDLSVKPHGWMSGTVDGIEYEMYGPGDLWMCKKIGTEETWDQVSDDGPLYRRVVAALQAQLDAEETTKDIVEAAKKSPTKTISFVLDGLNYEISQSKFIWRQLSNSTGWAMVPDTSPEYKKVMSAAGKLILEEHASASQQP